MKTWLTNNFQIISLIILGLLLTLILKQQKDINDLKNKIDNTENSVSSAESSLSNQIDDLRRTVIIWSK